MSVASLVLGLLWLGWVGSFLAVIFGHAARRQIKRSGGTQTGKGVATSGLVLGWIGIATLSIVVITAVAATSKNSGTSAPTISAPAAGPAASPTPGQASSLTVSDGKFTFTVKAVTCGIAKIPAIVPLTPKGKFCVVDMTVRNKSKQEQIYIATVQKLTDTAGRTYSGDLTASFWASTPDATSTPATASSVEKHRSRFRPGYQGRI